MCLLVIQHQNAPTLPSAWLADFYAHNQDGVGVMYAKDGKLIVKKILPKTAGDFESFYHKEITGKFCAFHLRMKTHGDINLENCHPYEVLNQAEHGIDLWLMHNGVLSTGNKADQTKSDTWHYIKNYLVPMLAKNPDFAFSQAFSEMVAEHIGSSNKFVLMDNTGRYQVINQDAGVKWGGMWLSNTYAWSAPYSIPKKSKQSDWQSQVSQEPRKRLLGQMGSFSTRGSNVANGYSTWQDDEYVEDEEAIYESCIDGELDDLSYFGYDRIGQMDYLKAYEFVYEYGIDGFLELTEMLREGNMTEQDFIRAMYDPDKAKRFIKAIGASKNACKPQTNASEVMQDY